MSEKVGIVITAEDRTAKGTASASKGVDAMRGKFQAMGKQVNAMPGQFGAASAAMMAFSAGSSQMGGAAADMGNKVMAVAAMMMVGGPFGIALAAITVMIIAFSFALDKSTESSDRAREAIGKLGEEMDETLDRTGDVVRQIAIMRLEMKGVANAALELDTVTAFRNTEERIGELNEELREMLRLAADKGITREQIRQMEVTKRLIKDLEREKLARMQLLLLTRQKTEADAAASKKQSAATQTHNAELDRSRVKVKQLEDQITVAGLSAAEGKQRLIEMEIWNIDTTKKLTAGKRAYLTSLEEELRLLDQIVDAEARDVAAKEQLAATSSANAEAAAASLARQIEDYESHAQLRVAVAEWVASEEKRLASEKQQMQIAAITAIGNATAQFAVAAMRDHENMGKAAVQAVISATKTIIMAYAAQAAAGALAGNSSIPIIGIVLGTAAAGIAFAMVEAYISDLPAFAAGGMPGASAPNSRDTILGWHDPREVIIPASMVQQAATGQPMTSAGNVTVAGGGGGATINVGLLEVPDRARSRRLVRDLSGSMREVNSRGQLFRQRAFA